MGEGEIPVPGVRALEHTADVGLELAAPSLPALFARGALGAMWLVLEREPRGEAGGGTARSVDLTEEDPARLLRAWLRTVLLWDELDGFVTTDPAFSVFPSPECSAEKGLGVGLTARVRGVVDEGPRVREIKGVTLHGLQVEKSGGGWEGRVIFDV